MILETIKSIDGVSEFAGVPNCHHWQVAGGRFQFVAAATSNDQYLLQVNSREFFDEELVRQTLLFALENESRFAELDSILVLPGLEVADYEFDTAVVLSSKIHPIHKADRPDLHQHTLAVFPAFQCEFSGDENDDELKLLYNKMVNPADFRRTANPIMRIKFYIKKFDRSSVGEERRLGSRDLLVATIGDLEQSPDSFVEFENFQHEVAKVTWNQGFELSCGGDVQALSRPDLLEWVDGFLVKGVVKT